MRRIKIGPGHNDFYCILGSNFLREYFHNWWIEYRLICRPRHPLMVDRQYKDEWELELQSLAQEPFPQYVIDHIRLNHPTAFPDAHYEFLRNFRIRPERVTFDVTKEGWPDIRWAAPGYEACLYEIPLLSLSKQLRHVLDGDTPKLNWQTDMAAFARLCKEQHVNVVPGGTRRCGSTQVDEEGVAIFAQEAGEYCRSVSNVQIAADLQKYTSGTVFHGLIMFFAGLYGYPLANQRFLEAFSNMYINVPRKDQARKRYGTVLLDTFTTQVGLEGLKKFVAELPNRIDHFPAVRNDSEEPAAFNRTIRSFVDETHIPIETIVHSDSLDNTTIVQASRDTNEQGFNFVGIVGGYLSSKIPGFKPIELVAKPWRMWPMDSSGMAGEVTEVCKLTNQIGKAHGSRDAVSQAIRELGLQQIP